MSVLICAAVLAAPVRVDPEMQSYRAHIEAASSALNLGSSRLALEWLQSAPIKKRGWEWDYLMAQCDASLASFKASEKSITKVQLSPDGKTVATASADGTVSLWDASTLAQKGVLKGHSSSVFGLDFSLDGRMIVTTSRDNSIRLWDAATAKEIGVLGDHPVTPYSAGFSPDGKKVVSVGWRSHPVTKGPVGLIRVWDVETRNMLHSQDYTTHPLSCLTFTPDGRQCLIGTWEYQTAFLDMESYKIVREVTPKESSAYKAVDWVDLDPLGGRLLTASKDKTAKVFSLETGQELASLAHSGTVTSARFTDDGKWIVTSSQDGAVRLFDAKSLLTVAVLQAHGQPINCVAVTPDGSRAFSGDVTGKVCVWDTSRPEAISPSIQNAGAWSCVFSPDGRRIAQGTNLRKIQVRDSDTMALLAESPAFDSLVVDAAWSPNGEQIAGGSNDGTVRAFSADMKTALWTFKGKGQFRATDWSSDGRFIAAGDGGTGIAHVIDAETGREVWQHKMAPGTLAAAISKDAKLVAFGSAMEVKMFSMPNGRLLKTFAAGSEVYELAFSPDGSLLAAGENNGLVQAFGVKEGRLKWEQKTEGSQWGLSFSPDGKRLASIGYDFALHLWEPKSGLEVFAVRDLPIQGFDVRFSPDGQKLAYMGGSGQTWVLDRRRFRERR